jgi:UDPglucose 6-dehydrogenase
MKGALCQPMRLTVIGIGYLGLTHAVCMADLGHEVIGLDADAETVARTGSGETPFFEPGLEVLLRKNLDSGRLKFTTSYAEAAEFGDVHFLCVGTPQAADGSSDMGQVDAAVDALAPLLSRSCLLVGKSTVPVGTARRIAARVSAAAPAADAVEVAWNPEFLREGFAIEDSLSPDRLVFGVRSEWSADLLRQVYALQLASGTPGLFMDLETAELVKVSANAFLATKISFINAMAEVCEKVGADVVDLADALAHDERIGRRFLSPGLGFGGGCLPKDIRAFRSVAKELGVGSVANLLGEVDAINLNRRSRVVELAREAVGGTLADRRITVLGLAF